MPGHHYTPAEYALQQEVESFSNLVDQLEEACVIHIYRVVCLFCEYENIRYLVLRYLDAGALPFEVYSEDRSFDG
jgi:hypothetical protein